MCCKCINRRSFLGHGAASLAAGVAFTGAERDFSIASRGISSPSEWDPHRPFFTKSKTLRVQPLLLYRTPEQKEQTSWKSWGGIQTEQAAAEELVRISEELKKVSLHSDCKIEFLPVRRAKSIEEIENIRAVQHDVRIVYPATGSGDLLRASFAGGTDVLIFVRHRSGPVYYWYEALSVRYLETDKKDAGSGQVQRMPVHVDDVVVDDWRALLWKLRALHAVHNFLNTKIVALGGAWGKYSPEAPKRAMEKFGMEIIDVPYDGVAARIRDMMANPGRRSIARERAKTYLSLPGTTLETENRFMENAFILYDFFRELLAEHDASVFTIKDCMGIIIPLSETTACLSLTLLNDEGYTAFCESDFVVIPAGVLLRHISGKPVFLHNSTFPHDGIVTCAHCSAPRRMDGVRYEPARIMTHYESEYGAAPKVEIPVGRQVSFIDPEYSTGRWLSFKGTVRDNPFLEICRSQQDVQIEGEWRKLMHEVRDSHWVMTYGDYVKEIQFASRKIGIDLDVI